MLETEIQATIVAWVDKKSFGDGINYARDTGKKIDQELKRKLELNLAKFQIDIEKARTLLKQAKKDGDKEAQITAQLNVNELQRWLTEAKRQLNNLSNTGDKDLSRLQAKFNSVNDAISWPKSIVTSIKWMWVALAAVVSSWELLKFIGSIDEARKTIWELTGATWQDFKKLQSDFTEVYKTVDDTAQDVARSIWEINTRFGLVWEPLQELTRQFLDYAEVNNTDVSTSIREVSRLLQDSWMPMSQAWQLMDMLTVAWQKTWISVSTLAEQTTNYWVQLRALGFSLPESIALLSKFEAEWVNSEAILAWLSKWLNTLAKNAWTDIPTAFTAFIEQLQNAKNDSEALALASEVLGAKAWPQLALAVREWRFEIEDYIAALDWSTWATARTASETETATDKFSQSANALKSNLIPAVNGLLGLITPLVNLLNTVVVAVWRLWPAFENITFRIALSMANAINNIIQNINRLINAFASIPGVWSLPWVWFIKWVSSNIASKVWNNVARSNFWSTQSNAWSTKVWSFKAPSVSDIRSWIASVTVPKIPVSWGWWGGGWGWGGWWGWWSKKDKAEEARKEAEKLREESKKEIQKLKDDQLDKFKKAWKDARETIWKSIEESTKNVKKFQDELEKTTDQLWDVEDKIVKRSMDIQKEIDEVNDKIQGKTTDEMRKAEMEKAIKEDRELQSAKMRSSIEYEKKLQEVKDRVNKQDSFGDTGDKELNNLIRDRAKLEKEIKISQDNVDKDKLAEAERVWKLTETERLLEEKKALQDKQTELVNNIKVEEELQERLAKKKEEFLQRFEEKYKTSLDVQTDKLKKSAEEQIELFRKIQEASIRATGVVWAWWWVNTASSNSGVVVNLGPVTINSEMDEKKFYSGVEKAVAKAQKWASLWYK